ncbi:hypothetical protein RYX36_026510, partial [Vicia faba]
NKIVASEENIEDSTKKPKKSSKKTSETNKIVASEENIEDSTKKPKKSSKKTSESSSSNPKIKREAFQLDYIIESFRPFRSCQTLDKSYLAWITKVEKKKTQAWKELGIFDLIQMSKLGSVIVSQFY